MSYPRKPTPVRHCAHCQRKMERRRFPSGVLEPLANFQKRKYCGLWCKDHAARNDPEVRPLAAMRPRKKRRMLHALLTTRQVLDLHRVYMDGGLSLGDIAQQIWQRFGYRNPESCRVALWRSFRLEGLPVRGYCESQRLRVARGKRPGRTVCSGCGLPVDELDSACKQCRDRHRWRRKSRPRPEAEAA